MQSNSECNGDYQINTKHAAQISGSSVPIRFLEIDIKDLPELWWRILNITVNDYLQFDPGHELYENAVEWLFFEDYDPVLDGEQRDVVSLHVIAQAFSIDVDLFRFQLQCVKDKVESGEKQNGFEKDPRGRKCGYLTETGLRNLLERCKRKEE